ncbi:MAG: hypothetical protein WCX88_01210 [Patescibacteria group bacterium]
MKNKKILYDILIIAIGVVITFLIAKFDLVLKLEDIVTNYYILAFFAGMFFVSFFTVVPASYVLISLASNNNLIIITLIAGIGALCGDLLIFLFVKNRLSHSLFDFLKFKKKNKLEKLRENKLIKIFLVILGAIIIASPFPDEIGVSLMGVSKLKKRYFIPISYILNSIGIYLLLLVSKSIT